MADWRDVMNARKDTDAEYDRANDEDNDDVERQISAALAIAMAMREVGVIIDYNGDKNNGR